MSLPGLGKGDDQHAGVLGLVPRDGGATGDVDVGHGEGVGDAEGAGGAGGAEGVDVGGVAPVAEVRVGAEGEGAAEADAHVGAAEDAGGAVGEGAGAVEGVGAVGAGEVAEGAEDVAGEEGEGTASVAAVGVGVAGMPVGAVGVAGAVDAVGVADVAGAGRVDMESVEGGERGNTGAGAEVEHVGAETGGGEEHVDDIARLHSCRLSASFCFVSVGGGQRSVHDALQLAEVRRLHTCSTWQQLVSNKVTVAVLIHNIKIRLY